MRRSPCSSNKATDVIMSDFTSYSGRIFRVLSQVLHGLCPGQFVQGVWHVLKARVLVEGRTRKARASKGIELGVESTDRQLGPTSRSRTEDSH
ncbi:hypothetical protein ELG88_28910 (plasmid) [Rhizobium leguminosarum]|nr:hypothetical protein ELG88_28910 [Rhizobium leguminosarum]